jgi:SOS response regulatory protein OraA/RecX
MTRPVVTALQARGRDRVAVELDGAPWRVVPMEAALVAGLAVGGELDRGAARRLGRELRRLEARTTAVRALRARDHTRASLEQRLEERGVGPTLRRETLDATERAGLVDDARFAHGRAELLASRGAGDLLIAIDLEQRGVPDEVAGEAIAALDPETERAARIVARRGASARTARYLASKGFGESALEAVVADLVSDGLG